MRSLMQWVGGEEEDGREESLLGDESSDGFLSLSPSQKVYAFAGCLVAGIACMFLSFIVFAIPIKFAILFTFGNVLAVGSTAFVVGFWSQLRMMFDPTRVLASLIYIGCVLLALVFALWIHSTLLTIIAMICEVAALVWYSLSYIPFAREMVSKVTIGLCDTEI